eukprot:11317313-Ditylum_brightwellii.AAC.1
MREQELLARIAMLETELARKNDENEQPQKEIKQQAEIINQQDRQTMALEKENMLQSGDKMVSILSVIMTSEGDKLKQGSLAFKGDWFEQGAAFGGGMPKGDIHELQGTKGENEKETREHNGPVGLLKTMEKLWVLQNEYANKHNGPTGLPRTTEGLWG